MRPHFLFNAINGIVMLLGKSPSDAEEALLDLADVFRALLKEGSSLSKLSDEVDLTEKYLRIEKVRFRDRLSVSFNLDEKCKHVLIPTMLLQPLAENAVIHVIESVGEGVIHVMAFVSDAKLTLIVENPYTISTGANIRKSNGIAMENIKQRLRLIYDLEARLVSGPRDGGIWRVVVTMPVLISNIKKKS
jgi:two-component system sensor histidine kinase AlgZ